MYYKKLYYSFILIIILFFCISCNKDIDDKSKRIISIESAIIENKYNVLKLSEFANSLDFVALETSGNNLFPDKYSFGGLNDVDIYYNKELFIFPFSKQIFRFDRSGRFLGEIGRYGQGQEEYIGNWSMDVDESNNEVYVMNLSMSIKKYTVNNKYLCSYSLTEDSLHIHFQRSFRLVAPDLFVFDLAHWHTQKYMMAFYDSTSALLELKKDLQPAIKKGIHGSNFEAKMYHFGNKVRYFRFIADTIYSIDGTMNVKPEFIFDYGRYKRPMDFSLWTRNYEEALYVFPTSLVETKQYLLMKFQFGALAPEPFDKAVQRGGVTKIVSIREVMAVFDKSTGNLHLLKQPQKGDLGFLNDLEVNGSAFWPSFVSSDGTEMVMLCGADEFIENYSKVKNPSAKLTKVLHGLQFDSNPVAIIAKLK